MKEYVEFDRLPSEADSIDALIVMGTSRLVTPAAFDLRVSTTIDYAAKSPESTVIFSGKQAYGHKAHPKESGEYYIEAKVMADEAISRGLDRQRVRLETKALNAKENVINSLGLLSQGEESVLFVSSGYMGRRIDLYLNKLKESGRLPVGDKQFFIVDADVRQDATEMSLTSQQIKRKEASVLYESTRIALYRAKGDL